ncbi:ParA family protein [Curvibacter sp. APW13]|uniref:ParA family protein n=1 Tax=Curvibacter sp. APW13 TaxID=3077236 RepID=UPI0028E05605|nr:ParA family protein [Curvibacter sp. APW13]MDT8991061.1 ParA family protein [Curvibacter sp. APW13]
MPVVAVVNRKGGSGKSTLATHLAAWMAHQGCRVMLGDVDRQQSTRTWLKRRVASVPSILHWTLDQKNILKPPAGVTHVVLDTPGGLQGFDLSRLVMQADAIVIPVCNSLFDRDSAAACHDELMAHPRVASGRCQLGVVGMRIDARTRGAEVLQQWAHSRAMPFWGVLREAQIYVRTVENGLTLFDLPAAAHAADLQQWQVVLAPLASILRVGASGLRVPCDEGATIEPPVMTEPAQPDTPSQAPAPILPARAAALMPAQGTLVHGDRFAGSRASG